MVSLNSVVNAYYVVIMAYAFLFLFHGFSSKLPWQDCMEDSFSEHCFSTHDLARCHNVNGSDYTFFNKTCMTKKDFCQKFNFPQSDQTHCINGTDKVDITQVDFSRTYATEEFWNKQILVSKKRCYKILRYSFFPAR